MHGRGCLGLACTQVRLGGSREEEEGNQAAVMKAVTQAWRFLQEVSEEMKGDRELCTAAVAQDWKAFHFVSEEMQGKPQAMHGSGCP